EACAVDGEVAAGPHVGSLLVRVVIESDVADGWPVPPACGPLGRRSIDRYGRQHGPAVAGHLPRPAPTLLLLPPRLLRRPDLATHRRRLRRDNLAQPAAGGRAAGAGELRRRRPGRARPGAP